VYSSNIRKKWLLCLITYFKPEDFKCKCKCGCGDSKVLVKLIEMLQIIRKHWDKSIIVNYAKRYIKDNKKVGSVNGSQHLLDTAANIIIFGDIVNFYEFIINLY